jgi:histidinol dehydrogenase
MSVSLKIVEKKEDALNHIKKITSRLNLDLEQASSSEFDVQSIVAGIISDVRRSGDKAVSDLLKQIDKVKIAENALCVESQEFDEARTLINADIEDALQLMAKRIADYAEQMKPSAIKWFPEKEDKQLGYRFTAIENIGAYVPGGLSGSTPLVSSVLMNLIPAKVAGVKNIVVATPPNKEGKIHPALLRACEIAGATVVYKAGGAQGVAAMALGTESCPQCVKIIGPGNAFVQEAKRQLFGLIDIDMMAGPSEIAIFADKSAKPHVLAADMLAQAEHDPLAASVVISDDKSLLEQTSMCLSESLNKLPKKDIAAQSIENYGGLLLCESIEQGCEWIDELAPEHLELILEDCDYALEKINHAGAIFIGPYTPEVVGDYTAGPSHTLPTCGAAKFSSGINVYTFLKSSSLLRYSEKAMRNDLSALTTMARTENLEGHARSAESRFED